MPSSGSSTANTRRDVAVNARVPAALVPMRVIATAVAVLLLLFSATAQRRATSPAETRYKQGIEFLNKNQPDRAITEFKSAIALKPDYAEAHNALGLALVTTGELQLASESFRKAISLDPK